MPKEINKFPRVIAWLESEIKDCNKNIEKGRKSFFKGERSEEWFYTVKNNNNAMIQEYELALKKLRK